jgi:hypothetical protein
MVDKQIPSGPAHYRASADIVREAAEQQRALAAELADDAHQLRARAQQLLAQRRADRAAIDGIGIAMLQVGRSTATVVALTRMPEPGQPLAA